VSTNVTSVVPVRLDPVIANLLASVVTAKLAKVTGKEPTFVKNAASLTFVPIVVPVVFCIGPVVIGPEKFVFAIIIILLVNVDIVSRPSTIRVYIQLIIV